MVTRLSSFFLCLIRYFIYLNEHTSTSTYKTRTQPNERTARKRQLSLRMDLLEAHKAVKTSTKTRTREREYIHTYTDNHAHRNAFPRRLKYRIVKAGVEENQRARLRETVNDKERKMCG